MTGLHLSYPLEDVRTTEIVSIRYRNAGELSSILPITEVEKCATGGVSIGSKGSQNHHRSRGPTFDGLIGGDAVGCSGDFTSPHGPSVDGPDGGVNPPLHDPCGMAVFGCWSPIGCTGVQKSDRAMWKHGQDAHATSLNPKGPLVRPQRGDD